MMEIESTFGSELPEAIYYQPNKFGLRKKIRKTYSFFDPTFDTILLSSSDLSNYKILKAKEC